MICAMTARRIADGRVEEFIEAFSNGPDNIPPEIAAKFKAIYACRDTKDPNVVLTFGLFDGSAEELQSIQSTGAREDQLAAIDPMVEEVLLDSSFNVVREFVSEMSPAG